MAARSIGSATISFGLVSVPVNLFSSSESSASVSFNMLHTTCGSRLKQQYICSKEGSVVEKDEIGKGYEFSKGQYVRFSAEEIKALDEKATNAIDIAEFVPLATVDRIYLEKVYYLGPDKGGDRAYGLLAKALQVTGRAALGQYSARGKQYLVLVRPMGDLLVMEQSAVDEFRPENYHDTVRERVLEAIQQKVDGQDITTEPTEAPQTKIIDLMDALKQSLAKRGGTSAEKQRARAVATKAAKELPARPRKKASGAR